MEGFILHVPCKTYNLVIFKSNGSIMLVFLNIIISPCKITLRGGCIVSNRKDSLVPKALPGINRSQNIALLPCDKYLHCFQLSTIAKTVEIITDPVHRELLPRYIQFIYHFSC